MLTYILLVIFNFFIFTVIGKKLALYDYPSERKVQISPVLNIGGLAVIFSYVFSIYLFNFGEKINLLIMFSLYFLLLGFIDDRISINPYLRIILQVVLAGYFLNQSNLYIDHIYLNSNTIISLSIFREIFTISCILVIINSFNYFDGIDLNLSIMAILILIFLYIFDQYLRFELLIVLILPIMIFSIFNIGLFRFPKIYLGDCGSTSLGFLISGLFLNYNQDNFGNYYNQQIIIWILALVVYEFLATTISRLINKKNIFEPGNDHLHYAINKFFKRKIYTVFSINLILILIFLIGFFVHNIIKDISVYLFIILFFVYFFIREALIKS